MSEKNIRVHIEFGDARVDFEGDVNQVFEAVVRFLSQMYPTIEILQRIVFSPDLTRLAENIAGLVEITSEGPAIAQNVELPARSAICLALLGAYVGSKIGKLKKDTLSTVELSKLTGKARKTVVNELPKLIDEGLVEKVSEGEYKITELGMRRTEDIIELARKGKMQSSK
ncbi:MAG: hypothetical protein QW502_01730 [Candidatus Bathyarchaeia archaeon]|nr:hypothetical protein [Candidatus Bathyarchaeota archaeon]